MFSFFIKPNFIHKKLNTSLTFLSILCTKKKKSNADLLFLALETSKNVSNKRKKSHDGSLLTKRPKNR